MYLIMPVIFVLGIVAIALEDKIRINKAATAVLMSILLWMILMLNGVHILAEKQNEGFLRFIANSNLSSLSTKDQVLSYLTDRALIFHLGNVSETLFFVMCSMLIVNIVDKHGGFMAVANYLKTSDKRRMLWYMGLSSFFFSALLDNLAAAIVLIAILRKLVPDATDRMKYASIIVIAANAGGSWSPIGDVTTLLLWTGGNIGAAHQITHVFLPALTNLLVPLVIAHFWLFKKGTKLRVESEVSEQDAYVQYIPFHSRVTIFVIGFLSLALVPVFQMTTHLPAFMCVLLGLVFLWIYTDLMYGRIKTIQDTNKLRISKLFRSVDLPTIFFFLGILMSVAALETGGQLTIFADFLSNSVKQPSVISFLVGLASSFTDNVALVAATMGMYPVVDAASAVTPYLQSFVADGSFWTFLAYCAVTGGSIFIIGSATGVTVMGLEKISFMYYFKRFTPLSILGYVAGAFIFFLWM
ncbi:MAG: sodium:proton antiporter NhaD [Petrimonas sp.]|nr:sodium:proton antiporter NhaD [Petrimonas sp.]